MENIKLTRQSNISQGNCNIHFPVKIRPRFISVIRHSNNTLDNVQNSNNNNSKITQAKCWLIFPMAFVKKRSWKTCRHDKAATFQAPAIFIHRLQENLEPMVLQSNHGAAFYTLLSGLLPKYNNLEERGYWHPALWLTEVIWAWEVTSGSALWYGLLV